VTTQNTYGDTTSFEFTHIQFKPMEPAIFEFKIPEGYSIIEMDYTKKGPDPWKTR